MPDGHISGNDFIKDCLIKLVNKMYELDSLFIIPERLNAGCSFADIPIKVSFEQSNVVFFGVPLDITTTFGKGTSLGPECIRLTSAKQIETFMLDEGMDIYEKAKLFDLGDLKLKSNENTTDGTLAEISYLDNTLPRIVKLLHQDNKIPVIMGGEHTLSYFTIKGLSNTDPLVIHFDAHRDMKPVYNGMKMCHTTPFYHLVEEGWIKGHDLIQIGIRQTDREENAIANEKNVTTFDAWHINENIEGVTKYISNVTPNRNIYISFDIDVYDLPYVPCTGTPEPFGLNPQQVVRIIKSISSSAKLIGMDMVEVSLRNGDYREGALATQTLFRILVRDFVR